MRKQLAAILLVTALTGCGRFGRDNHVTGGVLGRVVIYRNGVAFYERNARIEKGRLAVRVPRERVDDFLKSLTIVDRKTGQPLSVSIPRQQDDNGQSLTMLIETPHLQEADVTLTYVTEAPAWKPSYRIVVGKDGTNVMLEGWAVVDNTTSEDWNKVRVGVGASSALAFRYDLWSVHTVDRDLLQGEERFAVAPPQGVSPYSDSNEELLAFNDTGAAGGNAQNDGVGVSFSGSSSLENQYYVDGVNTTGLTYGSAGGTSGGSSKQPDPPKPTTGGMQGIVSSKGGKLAGATVMVTGPGGSTTAVTDANGFYQIPNLPPGSYTVSFFYGDAQLERKGITVGVNKVTPVYQSIDGRVAKGESIAISGNAPIVDQGSTKTGVTLTDDYTRNTPTAARSGACSAAPRGRRTMAVRRPRRRNARRSTSTSPRSSRRSRRIGATS